MARRTATRRRRQNVQRRLLQTGVRPIRRAGAAPALLPARPTPFVLPDVVFPPDEVGMRERDLAATLVPSR